MGFRHSLDISNWSLCNRISSLEILCCYHWWLLPLSAELWVLHHVGFEEGLTWVLLFVVYLWRWMGTFSKNLLRLWRRILRSLQWRLRSFLIRLELRPLDLLSHVWETSLEVIACWCNCCWSTHLIRSIVTRNIGSLILLLMYLRLIIGCPHLLCICRIFVVI
jgi:hypothetical protein